MSYLVNSPDLGFVDLYAIDTVGPGPLKLSGSAIAYGRFEYPGIEVTGVDPVLGGGTFLFVQYAGTVTAGGVCELTITNVGTNSRYDVSAQNWAGAANTGKPLAVSMAGGAAGQWGWVQTQGVAVTNTAGTPAANSPLAWQAAGVVSSTIVASKAFINAVAVSANGATYGTGTGAVVLPSSQTLVLLNRPCAQGPIT